MRKIEEKMRAAVDAGRSASLGNTVVRSNDLGGVEVRLHDNLIFEREKTGDEHFTMWGWATPTTRSRINALLKDGYVFQRKGAQYLMHGGREYAIDSQEIIHIMNGKVELPHTWAY